MSWIHTWWVCTLGLWNGLQRYAYVKLLIVQSIMHCCSFLLVWHFLYISSFQKSLWSSAQIGAFIKREDFLEKLTTVMSSNPSLATIDRILASMEDITTQTKKSSQTRGAHIKPIDWWKFLKLRCGNKVILICWNFLDLGPCTNSEVCLYYFPMCKIYH